MSERPYLIVWHADRDLRARVSDCLREVGRVDAVERLERVLDLLALAAADGLVVDLPGTAAERGVLGRIVAAYPEMHVAVIAASLPFEDAREMLRLGVHDIIPVSHDGPALAAAVRDGLARRRATGAVGPRGMAILVTSGKGGVGCTALALHLTAALTRYGTAASVDADAPPFGAMAAASDLDAGSSVAAIVRQHLPIEAKVLRRAGIQHAAGFATFALWGAPGDAEEVAGAIPEAMDALTEMLPFVVVDLGRPVLPAQRLLARRAGVAIAVATLDLLALRSVRTLVDLLTADGATQILAVLNREGGSSSYTIGQAEAALGMEFAAVLPETPALSRCLDDGTLLGAVAPDDPWWRGVERFASEIVDRRREELRGALGSPP